MLASQPDGIDSSHLWVTLASSQNGGAQTTTGKHRLSKSEVVLMLKSVSGDGNEVHTDAERANVHKESEALRESLDIINCADTVPFLLDGFARAMRMWTDCDAAGIGVSNDEDKSCRQAWSHAR